jgi:NADPH2:quinone reductase
MRRVVCVELGPPEGLVVEDVDPPSPGPGQVLVDVAAVGVNFVDALFVSGEYQIKPPLPFVPGSEVAGTVAAVGADVEGVTVGDAVMAMPGLGGYAEQVVLGARQVVPVPGALDAPRAATFIQSYATALFALTRRTTVAPDDVVLVLGAGGGVGLAAIDVATALGARVIGAASSDEKRSAAAAMGAAAVIDTTTEDLKARARELAGGHEVRGTGVDVVVDPIGGDAAEPALRALRWGGRYVVIGFAAGAIPSLPLNQVLLNNRTVLGVDWGAWSLREPAAQAALLDELAGLVEDGRLHPVAPVTYPLERAADALRDLLERRVTGKVALVTAR